MGKFSYSLIAFASIVAVGSALALRWQASVPANLAESAKRLQEAGTLTASVNVQAIGGAATQYQIKYSKPNLFRIDTADGFTLSDGQNLYVYKRAANEYTVTPIGDGAALKTASAEEFWGWAAFFDKEPFKNFKSASAGAQRNLKGNMVSEVNAVFGGDAKNSAIIFVDQKLGVVRGFTFKNADRDLLVVATAIELGKDPAGAAAFAFVEPSGSKKAEPPKVDVVPFAKVQEILNHNCMPCHSSGTRSGGMDFSNYDGVSRGVRPGEPDRSRIVRSITSTCPSRMPQGRAPLSAEDIKLIKDWIAGGAKNQ